MGRGNLGRKRNNLNGVEKVLGKDYAGISSLR